MKKNFVKFLSPGTFMAESDVQEIDTWDVDTAIIMSKNIKQRYNAVPYGFQFFTCERSDDELNSHETQRSGVYYLGGEIFTVEQLKEIGNPDDRILIQNMECNNWKSVVVNTNSWKWTQPLYDNDIVLDV